MRVYQDVNNNIALQSSSVLGTASLYGIMHSNNNVFQLAHEPTYTDVLLGRGVATNRHPGNENFRQIVSQHVVSLRNNSHHILSDVASLVIHTLAAWHIIWPHYHMTNHHASAKSFSLYAQWNICAIIMITWLFVLSLQHVTHLVLLSRSSCLVIPRSLLYSQ